MGIPYFFRKIVNEFPNIINVKTTLNDNDVTLHNLFLDFNCCIHGCSNELKGSDIIFNSNDEFEKALIERVLKYIDEIFDFVKPKELFYISIDGIPPRSKMVQQRNRRFMSSWKRDRLVEVLEKEKNPRMHSDLNKIKNEWNSDSISPGTDFMNNLSKAIKKKVTTEQKYKFIKTILSDSQESGEGEYKIFKYMYDNKLDNHNHNNININNVIYGLDADLIMLSLLTNTNIYLLREPMFLNLVDNSPFLFVSIEKFKENIKLFYNDYFPIDKEYLIKNYVFVCFLLGNDFIPHISYLNFKSDGLENLLIFYKKVSDEINENILYVTKNKKSIKYEINYDFLSKLFNHLSQIEDKELFECSEKYYNKKPYSQKCESQIEYYQNLLELFPLHNKPPNLIKLGTEGWRSRYYYHLFHTIDGKDIKNINHNYLESLEFTLDYYYHQKYHHTWYYRYNHSPTLLDLSNYLASLSLLKDINIDNINDINDTEVNTIPNPPPENFKINIEYNELYPDIKITIPLQLLMILPPSSINLIKNEEHKKLMTDINNGVLYYYPNDFYIDTYLKNWLWLCHPKLPDIDITLLNSKL